MTLQNAVATAATNAVLDILDEQPWYKRYAGTITTAAGGIVTFGTWLATAELGLPKSAQIAIGAVVLVASVVAARATKNGQTPRTSQEILDKIVPTITEAVSPQAGSLDKLVQDKAAEAASAAAAQAAQAATDAIANGSNAIREGVDEFNRRMWNAN
ncbi:hypothetical protein AXK57_21555 [Tsukamurella pulmonis]|uniref:hypothetical protein n=1 Tax=Tsukamurella pulmonis TaxID=47312 RepID=UPI00079492CA|nr:hypothetical protein [Tsukamurella pulmonis]KXP11672.1 hypothetical protein AXK57_21555 [Tsukamurella pulmonis]